MLRISHLFRFVWAKAIFKPLVLYLSFYSSIWTETKIVFVSYACVINSLRIENLKNRFFPLKYVRFCPHKVPFEAEIVVLTVRKHVNNFFRGMCKCQFVYYIYQGKITKYKFMCHSHLKQVHFLSRITKRGWTWGVWRLLWANVTSLMKAMTPDGKRTANSWKRTKPKNPRGNPQPGWAITDFSHPCRPRSASYRPV